MRAKPLYQLVRLLTLSVFWPVAMGQAAASRTEVLWLARAAFTQGS